MGHRSNRSPLNIDELMNGAARITGLSDFGDRWFMEPLSALLRFVNRDVGPLDAEDRRRDILVSNLADRLKLVDHLQHHPEVRDETLEVAGVIIVGRGGSTLLQRLLATSPQLTAIHYWELASPVPESDERPGETSRRIAQGQARVDAMYEATPELKGMHPMDAMTYDEEIVLMERGFLSLMFASYFNLPEYMLWLRRQDHRKIYDELKLWLQVLKAQAPQRQGRKWLLKSVHHLLAGGLRELLRVFPDAKIIMTHRDLDNVIASSCSGQSMLLGNFGNAVDNSTLGPRWIEVYREALRDMDEIRRQYPASRFIDLPYRDLIADPLGTSQKVMRRMGLEVGDEDERLAAAWLRANAREKHPPHSYRLEDFGLSHDRIAEAFRFYHDAYAG
jgi:hypothetical protein